MNAMKAFNGDTVTMTSAHTGTRYRVQVLAIPQTGISVVKGFRSATAALSHVPTLMEVFCCVSPGSCDLCSAQQSDFPLLHGLSKIVTCANQPHGTDSVACDATAIGNLTSPEAVG